MTMHVSDRQQSGSNMLLFLYPGNRHDVSHVTTNYDGETHVISTLLTSDETFSFP